MGANKLREQVVLEKKKRRIIFFTLGLLLFTYLSFSLIFGEGGFVRYLELKSTRADLQAEIKKIQDENEEVKKQVDILKKDPHAVEEFARELGLTREGEIIFKYKDETGQ